MKLALLGSVLLANGIFAAPTTTIDIDLTSTNNAYAPQFSPSFPDVTVSTPVYNNGSINVTETLSRDTLDLSKYPDAWQSPDVKHPEVQAVIKSIDWSLVPKIPVKNGDTDDYDDDEDPDCWWTSSGCMEPKVSYLPKDVYTCPTPGEWGLTYDDGPFNLLPEDDDDAETENPYAEPYLYNFLAQENVKASLFVRHPNCISFSYSNMTIYFMYSISVRML